MINHSEISSLVGAVYNADMGLRTEVLQIVAAASEPMCCKDIYEKSTNAPDSMTLSREVHLMTVKAGLLEIAEKKVRDGFREVAFYRVTALGQEHLRMSYTDVKVQPNTSMLRPVASTFNPINSLTSTEVSMGIIPSKLNVIIFNKVVEQPGIAQDELIKFALQESPESTEKQAIKTLRNLVHASKKIRAQGARYKRIYYVNNEATTPAKKSAVDNEAVVKHSEPVASVPVPRTGTLRQAGEGDAQREESKPVAKPSFRQRFINWLKPVASPVTFTLLLTDDNCLHLVIDDDLIMLTQEQTARLKSFMNRIDLAGNRA